MRAIWTDENKLRIWLQIELLASETLVKESIVPKKDFAKIKAGCDKRFADLPGLVERQKHHEKVLNHDLIGFTTAVAKKINDDASRWFHFGLTSSDVGDTCYAVQMVQSADIPRNTSSCPATAATPTASRLAGCDAKCSRPREKGLARF